MSKTLATLDAEFLEKIVEASTGGNFSAAERYGFINEAVQKIAVQSHNPRKFDSGTQGVAGTADYDAASDFVFLIRAWYGDATIQGDLKKLKVFTVQEMSEVFPGWVETASASQGAPRILIPIDRNTHRLYPTPDSANAASGKKLLRLYSYLPASLSAVSDIPDIPDVYHDVIKYYAAYLANCGRLQNPQQAALMLKLFDKEMMDRSEGAEKEAEEISRFTWGFQEP